MKKKCSVCGKTKDVSWFYRHGSSKDGYCNRCKACSSRHMATYYRENRVTVLKKVAEYRRTQSKTRFGTSHCTMAKAVM